MKFEECYRGFIFAQIEMEKNQEGIPKKNIIQIEPYARKKTLRPYSDKDNITAPYNSFTGVLAPDIVLIDVDNAEQGEKLWEILKDMGIDCPVIETTKGYHFLFRNNGMYKKSDTKFYTPIGIETDIKLGDKNGLEFLTVAGEERKILNDTGNIPNLPKFLYKPEKK